MKADYAGWRQAARYSQIGIPFTSNGKSAKTVPSEERERDYEAGWAEGGFNFVMTYPDLLTDLESNRTAADFVSPPILWNIGLFSNGFVKARRTIRRIRRA